MKGNLNVFDKTEVNLKIEGYEDSGFVEIFDKEILKELNMYKLGEVSNIDNGYNSNKP